MSLQISTRVPSDPVAIIEIAGELDSSNCNDLREEINHQVAKTRQMLLVDLRAVTFVDSTGLGVLVGGLKKMREREGRFILVSTHPRVKRILEVSGLVKVFSVFQTPEEALASDPGGGAG